MLSFYQFVQIEISANFHTASLLGIDFCNFSHFSISKSSYSICKSLSFLYFYGASKHYKIKKQQWLFQSLLLRTDVPIVSETHTSSDFINLLKKLNEKYTEGDIIRIVCDNHSAHKSKETTNFLATCPEGRFVLSRIFCMRCDQFLFLIYDDRHSFSPSAPNLFPIKYLCLVRS